MKKNTKTKNIQRKRRRKIKNKEEERWNTVEEEKVDGQQMNAGSAGKEGVLELIVLLMWEWIADVHSFSFLSLSFSLFLSFSVTQLFGGWHRWCHWHHLSGSSLIPSDREHTYFKLFLSLLKKLHDGTLVLTRMRMITSLFSQTVTRIITRILSALFPSLRNSNLSLLEMRRKFEEGEERSYEETWEEFCSCYNFVTLLEPRILKLKEIVIWIIPGWKILEIHRFLFSFFSLYHILISIGK